LDGASNSLKRPEIGEIGSRIGELYFFFYLRKSDPTVWCCDAFLRVTAF
jgi:hypothetical protein